MTLRPEFPLNSETLLAGLVFAPMRRVLVHQAQTFNLPVITDTDEQVTLQTQNGQIQFAATDDGIAVTLFAKHHDRLQMLKDRLIDQLSTTVPDAVSALRWSDAGAIGSLPDNFHFATVKWVKPVGTSFLRVRVGLPDLSGFGDDSIHFRLVLPPADLEHVEWPSLAENGSTIWPKGDKALHRPVYTTRLLDRASNEMEFDIFVHEGGRATEWARAVTPGARTGIVGPVGGGIPATQNILVFADETAFPAAARILEALPDDAQGHVTLLAEDGAQCAYAITAPPGISVTWLSRDHGTSLADLALKARKEFPNHFLWFACEKADVLRVRTAMKEDGADQSHLYISAYWSQP